MDSSNGAAIGGDLAYRYAHYPQLGGVPRTTAQEIMGDTRFALGPQMLQHAGTVVTGADFRLIA